MPTMELMVGGKTFDRLAEGFNQLADNLDKAIGDVSAVAAPVLMQTLNRVALEMAKRHGNPWNGQVVNGSANLQSRSGAGIASIFQSIKLLAKNDKLVAARISAGSLSFHEEGGTIRAKGAGYLTIPLPAALDPRGVPLKTRARQWDNTFVKRSKKGNLIIFRKIPGSRELTPLYVLKTEVYVRPRLGMEKAIIDEMGYFESKLFERLSDVIDQYL